MVHVAGIDDATLKDIAPAGFVETRVRKTREEIAKAQGRKSESLNL
jgi:hypothetical protein